MQRALRLLALARACDALRLLSSLCLVSVSCANELVICSGQHSALLITTRIHIDAAQTKISQTKISDGTVTEYRFSRYRRY
eukprot:SAG11_NODE_23819_length_382_cov_2.925795_1_plen_81_part_00